MTVLSPVIRHFVPHINSVVSTSSLSYQKVQQGSNNKLEDDGHRKLSRMMINPDKNHLNSNVCLEKILLSEAATISNILSIASDDKYASGDNYNPKEMVRPLNRFLETAEKLKDLYLEAFDNSESIDGKKDTRYLDELNDIFFISTKKIFDQASYDALEFLDSYKINNLSEGQISFLKPVKDMLDKFFMIRSEIDSIEVEYALENNRYMININNQSSKKSNII